MEKTSGDCTVRKRYSHIDLLYMIDAVETQKATIASGNRCYYMKVRYMLLTLCTTTVKTPIDLSC